VSDFIGQKEFLSVNDIKTLQASGMVIGNHGKRHRPWRGMAAGELREELVEARDRLEQIIAKPIRHAACPYGEYDRRVLAHLRESGYERVYTSDGGRAHKSRWLQPRNSLRCHSNAEAVRRLLGETRFSVRELVRMCKRSIKRWR
jgi:peptidoglycan/xylan/chitin deacetylase (PgdA/CDA1 family)